MVFVMVLLCINAKNQQEIISKMRTNTAKYNRNFSFGTLYYVNDMVWHREPVYALRFVAVRFDFSIKAAIFLDNRLVEFCILSFAILISGESSVDWV